MSNKPKPSLKGGVGTQRLQPIRATQPFQLRQGASPARKSPSSSPTSMLPRSATDPRRNKWSSDHRNSPDRSDRKSPSSPGIKVTNRRSPSPRVCRTSSHDSVPAALTGTYLTGQWPRELTSNSFITPSNSGTSTKSTQTPHDWNSEACLQYSKNSKSLSNRQSDVEVTKMKQQMRRIAKSSRQEKKERQSPVHANHAALPQSQTAQSRSISNPMPIYGRVPRRQNSLEGLNKEIEIIILNETPVRHTQGVTPPDGHRAPLPRSSTRTMETQTPQGFAHDNNLIQNTEGHTPSPSSDQTLAVPTTTKVGEQGQSPCPKYASSPRPNNSYMFQREPPEGAESVTPFKEQDISPYIIGSSCPDKQKVHFQISKNGSFTKWKPPCPEQNNNGDVLLSLSSAMKVKCEVEGKNAFNIDDM
ncbi:glucocorticoid-induced transcript 1 protein-like isoform X2 [Styela clava]|uniref:glucocorticoid-induced transcript 1 protein-like isoform X2 n=1 Tax=Styela clava TaxID=7725 RepID=UPI00193A4641|nr:glucocorticoid-induced transcript 1 protein-like isoform X2 [Styela clava]